MTDYFQLLGQQPSFALDMKVLESAYFSEQRKYHPDRYIGKTDAERIKAAQLSVDINKAYQTLKAPLKRAQYLLHLNGIEVGTDKDTVKPSQELLMEIMELRENPPDTKKLAQMMDESINRIGNYYETSDMQAMAQETLRLGYLQKTLDDTHK